MRVIDEEKKNEVFEYVAARKDYPPTVREIQEELGIRSTATVYKYVQMLISEGKIIAASNKARTIRAAERQEEGEKL